MTFLNNKYSKYYFAIIGKAKNLSRSKKSGYFENHYIIPKSLGGDNDISNTVLLTAREHFICHMLLTKMTVGLDKRNMCYAVSIMVAEHRYFPKSSKLYEKVRILASEARLEYWRELRNHKILYSQRCEVIKRSQLGKKLSLKHKAKLKVKSEEAGANYVVVSPQQQIFKPTNFAAFCREHGISHTTIKQAYHFGKGDKQVQKGPSAGWRIIERTV